MIRSTDRLNRSIKDELHSLYQHNNNRCIAIKTIHDRHKQLYLMILVQTNTFIAIINSVSSSNNKLLMSISLYLNGVKHYTWKVVCEWSLKFCWFTANVLWTVGYSYLHKLWGEGKMKYPSNVAWYEFKTRCCKSVSSSTTGQEYIRNLIDVPSNLLYQRQIY